MSSKSAPAVIFFLLMTFSFSSAAQSQKKFGTGALAIDKVQYQSLPAYNPPAASGVVPDDFDLSSSFPDPGNQGSNNTCVAWAASYLKSYNWGKKNGNTLFTADSTFSPSYIYNRVVGDPTCRKGMYASQALNLLTTDGGVPLRHFPVRKNCSDIPSDEVNKFAAKFRSKDFKTANVLNRGLMKSTIVSGIPVMVIISVHESFQNHKGGGVMARASGREVGNHAVIIVGYNEKMRAYKILNSYGMGWGEGGFGWISYEELEKYWKEAYVLVEEEQNISDVQGDKEKAPSIAGNYNENNLGKINIVQIRQGETIALAEGKILVGLKNIYQYAGSITVTAPVAGIKEQDMTLGGELRIKDGNEGRVVVVNLRRIIDVFRVEFGYWSE